jgi:hypothetical protein
MNRLASPRLLRLAAPAPATKRFASTTTTQEAGTPNAVAQTFYRFIGRRNTTYLIYIFGGAIVAESLYGKTVDGLWNSMNRGVRVAIWPPVDFCY